MKILLCSLVLAPLKCNNHYMSRVVFKGLRWIHNPLSAVMLTVLKLNLRVAAAIDVGV